jgi:hypothetical protein
MIKGESQTNMGHGLGLGSRCMQTVRLSFPFTVIFFVSIFQKKGVGKDFDLT